MNSGGDGTGLLEYFNTSEWVPVCFTQIFSENEANVACQQLGYPFATNLSSTPLPYGKPGIGINRSHCSGTNRSYLFYCVRFEIMACQMQLHLTCYNSKYSKIYITNFMYVCNLR